MGAKGNPVADSSLFDFEKFPAELYAKPGDKVPNRKALATYGSWLNSTCREKYGQPAKLPAKLRKLSHRFGWGDAYAARYI